MKFLEKDLEDIIWESDNEKLQEKGLCIEGKKIRQLKIGNYGISDIISVFRVPNDGFDESHINITIYELKKEKAGISAFLQAVRYCKGIKLYVERRKPNLKVKYNIVLCAKEIDTNSDYIFLTDLIYSDECGFINSVTNYSFKYGLDGMVFKEENNYELSNNKF